MNNYVTKVCFSSPRTGETTAKPVVHCYGLRLGNVLAWFKFSSTPFRKQVLL